MTATQSTVRCSQPRASRAIQFRSTVEMVAMRSGLALAGRCSAIQVATVMASREDSAEIETTTPSVADTEAGATSGTADATRR